MEEPPRIPRPRLVLSVGVAGHRANKLAEQDVGPVSDTLRAIYRQIDDGLAAVARSGRAALYTPEAPLVRLLSGLAEGADRLAVEAAPPAWRLEAVLPMPRADYALDFTGAGEDSPALVQYRRLLGRMSSVTELPRLAPEITTTEHRAAQYGLLADFLVRQIDVLIAVWDGQAAAGPGGTGAVVEQAISLGCLVVWINPAERGAPRLLEGERAATAPLLHSRPLTETVLTDTLKAMLLPALAEEAATDDDLGEEDPLPVYFHSRWPGALHLAIGYSLLRLLGGGRRWKWPVRYASYHKLAEAWTPFLAGVTGRNGGPGPGFDARVRDVLLPRSVWADALAWYYGQLYRSAYVTTFLLGGLAVPVGLCYLFFSNSPAVLDIKAGFATVELLIILVVVLLVQLGSRQKWHRLWLETREMSELLRLGRSLAYVGSLKQLTEGANSGKGGGATLPVIYARATFRELGLPNAVLDSDYLRRVLGTTLRTELREQQDYHRKNIAELEGIDHALHRIGNACFVATIAVTAIFLAGWVIDLVAYSGVAEGAHGEGAHAEGGAGWAEWFHELLEYVIKPSASILAAGLPAFGAAFAGIRAQSNFGELVRRSEATLEDLTDVAAQIGGMVENAGRAIGLPNAAEVLLAFGHAMAADLGGWRQLFVRKPLVLPG
ncbi:MAG TPA: hypothetical protein VL418_06350 [Devosiaceae bacterium]|nr:hypothetical protein [Devosiaceae bacterium]